MDLPFPMDLLIKPMVFVIELMGMLIKHFVLAVRLLANMIAGHIVLAGACGVCFGCRQCGGIVCQRIVFGSEHGECPRGSCT